MEFTPRIRQILFVLLNHNEALSVKELAQKINVSKRTVQRELDYTNYILKNYQLKLCSKTGKGIWLEGEESQRQILLEMLEKKEDRDFADKLERRKSLMLELLKDQTPKKLYYFANLFSVSEATISKDMENIEAWFAKFDLHILRKQGFGVALQGSEKNIRIAIREYITKYMDTPVLKQLYEANDISTLNVVGIQNIKHRYQLLDENILKRVTICLTSIPDKRIRRLTQESYIGLVLHITIAIERIQGGEIIESHEELMNKLKQDEDYNLALLIVNSLEDEFEMDIPDMEIVFICLHIKGSKLQQINNNEVKDNISTEFQEDVMDLVQGMIIAYDEHLANVLSADYEFVAGLAAHLRPTLVRLRNDMSIENPHLDEIKMSYSVIYERCLKVGKYLETTLNYDIPETEIGFLAIHFGAALVRMESENENKRIVNIGLVCGSGIGISRLMASRLNKFLKIRANLNTYGQTDLTTDVLARNDFLVSSIDLGQIDIEVLQVSPLLPEEDLLRVDKIVEKYAATPKDWEFKSDFIKQMDKINNLSGRIKEILRNFWCIKVEKSISFQELLEIAAQNITSNPESQKWIVEGIKKREQLATQIIPELGIALLHARVKGISQIGFYVCVPESQNKFIDAYLQSIDAAVIMLVPDDEYKQENSNLLSYLSESLIEEENFLLDIKSGEEIQIKESLSKLLKKYFNKYLDVL